MNRIEESDVLEIAAYEKIRPDFQNKAMAAKAVRRVAVGPLITVFFENRLTMQYQLQEILRVEQVTDEDRVREEMAVWNDLIPAEGELSTTLMIEETDLAKAKETLHRLRDLEQHVTLEIAKRSVAAKFETGWKDENRISAVQFIKFELANEDESAFKSSNDVWLKIDHPAYSHAAKLSKETLEALRADLAS
jgi:hypothetical protein